MPGACAVQGSTWRPPLRPAAGLRPPLLPGLHPQLAAEDRFGGRCGHRELVCGLPALPACFHTWSVSPCLPTCCNVLPASWLACCVFALLSLLGRCTCCQNWVQRRDSYWPPCSVQALRTCPVCRTQSWFVVPSLIWPTTPEEKEQIVGGARRRVLLDGPMHACLSSRAMQRSCWVVTLMISQPAQSGM